MPASRSRTQEWRRSLEQLLGRDGALEIAIARESAAPAAVVAGGDLVWRVRLVDMTEQQLIVESPYALGRGLDIAPGTDLVCAIAIGQNRWMFKSRTLGYAMPHGGGRSTSRGLRIEMPVHVERCSRRALRVDVAELRLPSVEMWPLFDPTSVVLAERSNELAYAAARAGEKIAPCSDELLPAVGPRFAATVVNIGVPVCAAGRVVHTHIDSTQRTYAGVSFEFTFNPSHQRTVADQIAYAIHRVQQEQSAAKRAG